ncbi:hypothetical protein D3Z45_01225 [Lachnospiraceae bacterium]|nr:hypothetical protein [Lachnospiraceae bacterium]
MKKIFISLLSLILVGISLFTGCGKGDGKSVAWYEYKMIAHAGGGIDGKTMTNSLEALNLSKQNGYRLIEIDFQLTSDNILVLKHDFSKYSLIELEQPTIGDDDFQVWDSETFKNTKIYRKYTSMTIDDLVDWMKKNPDVYIVTDTKETQPDLVREEFSKIVEACENDYKILSRFIVQIYTNDMLDVVKAVYDFPNILYTIYQVAEPTEEFFYSLADFCVNNDIKVVTIPSGYLWQPFIDILKENDLMIYTHTLNKISELEKAINMNVDGIYTDFLYENDMQYINMDN